MRSKRPPPDLEGIECTGRGWGWGICSRFYSKSVFCNDDALPWNFVKTTLMDQRKVFFM